MTRGGAIGAAAAAIAAAAIAACQPRVDPGPPTLRWYVADERSGAFAAIAAACSRDAAGAYAIRIAPLPADADQQREQLARRLAARDRDIDLIGMDVIWTAEFAAAGWILPLEGAVAQAARADRLAAPLASASWQGRLWGVPFTSNAQLLWYRRDRVAAAPRTWDEMIAMAESLGELGTIQVQGERYEGLTVLFVSLLASAGGSVLEADGASVALPPGPTARALAVMRRLATSPAADRALANAREDQARIGFESGGSSFMINYSFVWPSAQRNVPQWADRIGWARWPAVVDGVPSRVAVGGYNLGVSAFSRWPQQAMDAAACIGAPQHQRLAAVQAGLPPTIAALYDDPQLRAQFPFADVLRDTLRDAVQRPQTPLYNDVSLAIARTLHPMRDIDPQRDDARLRGALQRALRSEGLL
ncbi:MAG TPA: ABC transporter substrate-binding protein [Burkholderiaceae bacterium]|nr:ABC transporter substrate-binding protein [Burkholderiaceae bacterium]